ncbi:MAG: MBL fold metallo-hydrolase [Desulfurococcales archaeon]|nr:MBL fold metallo-hydrolase [Desulfurococcales archaeon]
MIEIVKTIDFPLTYPANHYLVKTDNGLLQIDAGAKLANNQSANPDYVLITHWHWDHTYGVVGRKDLNICISKDSFEKINPEKSLDRMREIVTSVEGPHTWKFTRENAEIYVSKYIEIFQALREDHNVLWLEECPPILEGLVSYIKCPGHSDDHVCFIMGGNVFVGDNMAPGWNVTLNDPMQYIESMYRLLQVNWDVAYPGHGDPLHRRDAVNYIVSTIRSKIRRMCKTLASLEPRSDLGNVIGKVYGPEMNGPLRYVAARSLLGYLKNLEEMNIIKIDKSRYPWQIEKL